MKRIYILLAIGILVTLAGCIENRKSYDLIGRKGIIEYSGVTAHVYYKTEKDLDWKTINENKEEAAGSEELNYKKFSNELHFLNWIEKDGTTISQVINTRTGEVKTFWSFDDPNSDRGKRSFMFLDGKFSFDE